MCALAEGAGGRQRFSQIGSRRRQTKIQRCVWNTLSRRSMHPHRLAKTTQRTCSTAVVSELERKQASEPEMVVPAGALFLFREDGRKLSSTFLQRPFSSVIHPRSTSSSSVPARSRRQAAWFFIVFSSSAHARSSSRQGARSSRGRCPETVAINLTSARRHRPLAQKKCVHFPRLTQMGRRRRRRRGGP